MRGFFQEPIMSHGNKLMKPMEIARECLLFYEYPSLHSLGCPKILILRNQKQGQAFLSVAQGAHFDLMFFSGHMNCFSLASHFKGPGLFASTFVWIYKSCHWNILCGTEDVSKNSKILKYNELKWNFNIKSNGKMSSDSCGFYIFYRYHSCQE